MGRGGSVTSCSGGSETFREVFKLFTTALAPDPGLRQRTARGAAVPRQQTSAEPPR